MWAKKGQSGFTIVELLIVIVVIAILASLAFVAFNGVQDRSANSARVASARKMLTLLKQYVTINGADSLKTVMPSSPSAGYCMGANYTDADPDTPVACRHIVNTSTGVVMPSYTSLTALDNALRPLGNYDSSYPEVIWSVSPFNYRVSSPYVARNTDPNLHVDGKPGVWGAVFYALKGTEQDCILKPQLKYVSTVGSITNYTITDGSKYASTFPTATFCTVYFNPDSV